MKNVIVFIATLGVCLAGCEKSPVTGSAEVPTVKIEPVITKATSTDFEDGDRIGLTIRKADGTLHADNACLEYSDQLFSSTLKWYADGGEACSISAYYPYVDGGVPASFTVASDQSAGAGASDFMSAAKQDVHPQEGAVMAVFRHRLTQLIITIDNKGGADVGDVTVKGVIPTVNINTASDGTMSVVTDETAEAVTIKAEVIEPGKKYRVIMAPQKRAFEVKVAVEGATLVTGVNEAELLSGYTYAVGVEVRADMAMAKLSGEIENWEDGGVLGGTVVDESEAEENDGYIIYRGARYNTVVLGGRKWMAEPLAYLPEGITPSDDPAKGSVWYPYSYDGETITPLKDEASIKAFGYLYNYETAFGTAFTDDNFDKMENAQGICPKGWHIPSRDEFISLFGYSNKREGESSTVTDKTALFWDATADYATVAKANEAGFNFSMGGCMANGGFNTVLCSATNCSVEEYYGKQALTYIMASTANKININKQTGAKTYQMFAGMTTFTLSGYPLGRLSVTFSNWNNGNQVRCIKNQ